jgi:diguanylate cyclase
VQPDKPREILRALERAGVEHLTWLMRVHAALMFPDTSCPPKCYGEPGGIYFDGEELQGLERARVAMHLHAGRLLASAGQGVDPESYRAFMAAVDAFGREARRCETHFRRLLIETDPLTGLWNRQGMMRDLRREWTRILRNGRPACIAMADLDYFKQINDVHGHVAGDRVLCATAAFFRRRLRPYDMTYRYGGEEFLFCLPDTPLSTARRVLDRVRSVMGRTPIEVGEGVTVTVTCSIGLAEMAPGRSVQDTIEAADRALYEAKESGRNRICTAPSPPGRPPQPRDAVATGLRPVFGARQ